MFIYQQHNGCALSALLCRFTCHWIGQLALALFHGNNNLTSIDGGTQNTLQFIKPYPVYDIFKVQYCEHNNNNNNNNNNNDDDDDKNNNTNIIIIII